MEMKKYTITVNGMDDLWLLGHVDDCAFVAKVYDVGSIYGIDNGRVSKLGLYDGEREVVNYDRGWDKYPGDTDLEDTMEALLLFLADIPEAKRWGEIRRDELHIIELEKRKKEVIS